MSHAGKAAVITTVDQDDPTDLRSLRSVIECSGSTLGQFIVVVDALPDRDLAEFLDPLTRADSRVKLIWNFRKLGKVESYNRGLAERGDDAVILRSDTLVTPGWLEELAAVAHSEARTACAAPLTNDGGICSVPETPWPNASQPNRTGYRDNRMLGSSAVDGHPQAQHHLYLPAWRYP